MSNPFIPCTLRQLPAEHLLAAAARAVVINPINRPSVEHLANLPGIEVLMPAHLALLTTKYWGSGGVKLTVGFLDNAPSDLQQRILAHMNAWAQWANVNFVLSQTSPQVRITRTPGDGYWSYLGTDILSIPADQPTMNLDSFSMNTPESEYHRVVRHETGHTLGFPHEHMRREIVQRIDPGKAISYFFRTQGWPPQVTQQQVLTPLDESSLLDTPPDVTSIMCYQLPASITKDGQPIPGGTDIDPSDQGFAAKVYPPKTPPPPPPPQKGQIVLSVDWQGKTVAVSSVS